MSYGNNNYYKAGSWNVICDVCGVRFKAGEVRKRWDGLIVCHKDWEPDHPQKYIRVPTDPKQVPFIRTEPADQFIGVCTVVTKSALPSYGQPGCIIPSFVALILPSGQCTQQTVQAIPSYMHPGCVLPSKI